MADTPLVNATLVLLTPARAKATKKTHIKIIAPEDIDFDPDLNANLESINNHLRSRWYEEGP